jgi:hypothetical protein
MSYDLLSLKIAKAKPTSNGCSTSLADYGTLVFRLGVFFFLLLKTAKTSKKIRTGISWAASSSVREGGSAAKRRSACFRALSEGLDR